MIEGGHAGFATGPHLVVELAVLSLFSFFISCLAIIVYVLAGNELGDTMRACFVPSVRRLLP